MQNLRVVPGSVRDTGIRMRLPSCRSTLTQRKEASYEVIAPCPSRRTPAPPRAAVCPVAPEPHDAARADPAGFVGPGGHARAGLTLRAGRQAIRADPPG